MEWYVIVLIVSAGLFLLTTIISLFFGDADVGMNADIDVGSGFMLSDVISFKGLIHFTIGFSLTLTLMNEVSLKSVSIGVITGIIFVLVLYYIYKFVFEKLHQSIKYTTEIIDMEAEVYYWDAKSRTGEVFIILEGRPVTIKLVSPDDVNFAKGQVIKVSGTRQSVQPTGYIV